jgi:polygalacturonase
MKILLAAALAFPLLQAQDTRHVSEPAIPPSRTVLSARLASPLPESAEGNLDTRRIQDALDHCPAGRAVELKSDGAFHAFLSGPLELRAGVTLLVDAQTILYGSRDPRLYDVSPGVCGTVSEQGRGCKPLIGGHDISGAAVMGDGVIDGRGGAKLLGQNVSWWDLAQQAKVDNRNQNCPRILVLNHADNFTLYRITLKNSPNFHVSYNGGNGFTVWGIVIDTPKTARNTDGVDPGSGSTNITITHSYIHAGDDQVAIKGGGAAPTTNITIAHNHFYTGHGVSIGSETYAGVNHMLVTDLSIDGADNGIRIKSNQSRGGEVHDIRYDDVCIRDTKNPIFMDTHYSYSGKETNRIPLFTGIVLHDVRIFDGGKITLDGYSPKYPLGIVFDGVTLADPSKMKIVSQYSAVTLGPGPVNFRPSGEGVVITGNAGKGILGACKEKFVPLPAR